MNAHVAWSLVWRGRDALPRVRRRRSSMRIVKLRNKTNRAKELRQSALLPSRKRAGRSRRTRTTPLSNRFRSQLTVRNPTDLIRP